MNKMIIILIFIVSLTSCAGDRLFPIRRLARSESIEDKSEASLLYQDAVKTLMEAYKSNAGLNEDIGNRLMNMGFFDKAIEHFTIASKLKNNDRTLYHNIAICNVSLYKINNNEEHLREARNNYEMALRLDPNAKGVLYDYAQLLVFGYEDYLLAIDVLNRYIYELSSMDKDGYFLLGRSYYAVGEFKKASQVYNELYKFEKKLSDEEISKLNEFMNACLSSN